MSIWRLFRRRLWKLAFNLEKNGIMFILVRFMKKSRKVVFIFAVGLLVFLLVFTIYRFNSPWSGFSEKTLWDWLQLLIIPLVLAVIAISFNRVERKNEQAIAIGNQRETALQTYLDKMSELLLKEGLRNAVTDAEVCSIARARTLTVLRSLDGVRKGSLLMFLYEANLVHKDKCIIDLEGAYLHEAKLPSAANLRGVKLNGTFMMEARLHRVDLRDADLVDIRLTEATLSFANLSGANLSKAWMPHS